MTKQKQAYLHLLSGNYKDALKLFKGFKMGITKDKSSIINRGWGCVTNPSFYTQLGFNVDTCVEEAVTECKNYCFKVYKQG